MQVKYSIKLQKFNLGIYINLDFLFVTPLLFFLIKGRGVGNASISIIYWLCIDLGNKFIDNYITQIKI